MRKSKWLHNLVKDIRSDPKKYLNVKVSLF